MSYQFNIDVIKEFFMIDNDTTVSRIISENVTQMEYEHEDLDTAWIEARVKKHLSQQFKTIEE